MTLILIIILITGEACFTYQGLVRAKTSTRADNWCLKVSPTVGLLRAVRDIVCLPSSISNLTPRRSCQTKFISFVVASKSAQWKMVALHAKTEAVPSLPFSCLKLILPEFWLYQIRWQLAFPTCLYQCIVIFDSLLSNSVVCLQLH